MSGSLPFSCMADETPIIHLTVSAEQHGRPLAELVAAALGAKPVAQELIERGGLWVDGVRVHDTGAQATAGAALAIHRPLGGVYPTVTLAPELIFYEEGDLLALAKPAGMYVTMTPWDTEANLQAALVRLLQALRRRYPLVDGAGHEHVAPGRKADPGAGFDWTRLARACGRAGPHQPVIGVRKA